MHYEVIDDTELIKDPFRTMDRLKDQRRVQETLGLKEVDVLELPPPSTAADGEKLPLPEVDLAALVRYQVHNPRDHPSYPFRCRH